MQIEYVLDAHALIWFLEGSARLGAHAREILENPKSQLVLPIISLAEACWVVEAGKSSVRSVSELMMVVDADLRVVLLPLDRTTLTISTTLTAISEMLDRLIAGTAIALERAGHTVQLLTKDENIRRSGLVSVLW